MSLYKFYTLVTFICGFLSIPWNYNRLFISVNSHAKFRRDILFCHNYIDILMYTSI